MENTNCKCDCPFVKQGFCNSDKECPFYTETIWQLRGGTEIKTVKDCFPKRFTMEQSNVFQKLLTVQSLQDELRSRLDKIEQSLSFLIQQSEAFLREKQSEKLSGYNSQQIVAPITRNQIE